MKPHGPVKDEPSATVSLGKPGVLCAAVFAATVAAAGPASAACTVQNAVVTCSGVLPSGNFFPDVSSLTVSNVVTPNPPPATPPGILILNTAGAGANNVGDPPQGVDVTLEAPPAFSLLGLIVDVSGGGGNDGIGPTHPNGNTGQSGGDGGSGVAGGAGTTTVTVPGISFVVPANPNNQGQSAIQLLLVGGGGGKGVGQPQQIDDNFLAGGDGGSGGASPAGTLTMSGTTVNLTGLGNAVSVTVQGGNGGSTGSTASFATAKAGFGGAGGAGLTAAIAADSVNVTVAKGGGAGILAQSIGGNGANGGEAVGGTDEAAAGGNGGSGGNGGPVSITGSATVTATTQGGFDAIRAESIGGSAGSGGDAAAEGGEATGGNGGLGGAGGTVTVGTTTAPMAVTVGVTGNDARGVYVRSVGAEGGSGGASNGNSSLSNNGAALGSGPGGTATAILSGSITTSGQSADGVVVQSIGGFAGGGDGYGATVASAGAGDTASLALTLAPAPGETVGILTGGSAANAVVVQSIGGGGGLALGSVGGLQQLGGIGIAGGDGGEVMATISGTAGIMTGGAFARGVSLESIGGGGGNAGINTSVSTLGASGGSGGDGGNVTADIAVAVTTTGDRADGIHAASLGGGGGSAQSTSGAFTVGGSSGQAGGDGGSVSLSVGGPVATSGEDADAVSATSIGGGGGDGASVVAGGFSVALAVGGSGGVGGFGNTVSVTQPAGAGAITTGGDRSRGVLVQSIGGGGGTGGHATAVSAGFVATFAQAVGGKGGAGGEALTATASLSSPITTTGDLSDGVLVQSIGGGGGAGGGAFTGMATLVGIAVNHTVGGKGGNGGASLGASATVLGDVMTSGRKSAGVLVQSIGGGGGQSGLVGSVSGVDLESVDVTVGADGGNGGNGGPVSVSAGNVTTTGDGSPGVLGQSIGGGGGHVGNVISGTAITVAPITVDIGATGGAGGSAGTASASAGAVSTAGAQSSAVSALSVGGGGGSGHDVLNANTVSLASVDVTIGSSGGGGGNGAAASVTATGTVTATGPTSDGLHAASIGGAGGGVYGFSSKPAATGSGNLVQAGSIAVTLGGDGGKGGSSGNVTATADGDITVGTAGAGGAFGHGILAQSLAGGGGKAAGALTADLVDIGNVAVTIGGAGGSGGNAGTVTVDTAADTTIRTYDPHSHGILAQSIGGAGGVGGFAAEVSVNLSVSESVPVSGQVGVTIGGSGGNGGSADTVTVTNNAAIATADLHAAGILAQSIGGHGGAGGNVYAGNLQFNTEAASINVNVDIGGSGGGASTAGMVTVKNSGAVSTDGYLAPAILAQSIGGAGGDGGSSYAILGQLIGSAANEDISVNLGGSGGSAGKANEVMVTNDGAITTQKGGADGIVAQSIGGDGGRGGNAGYLGFNLTAVTPGEASAVNVEVGINAGHGGDGGTGADADTVTVSNTGSITTSGTRARGIFAQSIGGGGGDGGTTSASSFGLNAVCNISNVKYLCPTPSGGETSYSITADIEIGGKGAGAGNGAGVTVTNSGAITTSGQVSHAIYAQSVGGGGGNGGDGALGINAWTSNETLNNLANLPSNFLPSFTEFDIVVGGGAGASGKGGAVSVTNSGTITVNGPDSSIVDQYTGLKGGPTDPLPFLNGGMGIFAQSVGGGGGDGGAGSSSLSPSVTIGNGGSGGGDGGAVTVMNEGEIHNLAGFSGIGIFAQSVGGGGGVAGNVGLGFSDSWENLNIGVGVGAQGDGGAGGDGGVVMVTTKAAINTTGVASHGIVAHSVGGSGGIAGISPMSSVSQNILVGSGGAGGNGGDVTVMVEAPITVSGEKAAGAVAFSMSGVDAADTSGTVSVTAASDITASGAGGRGILAGSISLDAQMTGAVTVTVDAGATVATGSQGAETVGIRGAGAGSALDNAGTITSGNASSYAVRIDAPVKVAINNTGTITGQVLSSGTAVLENRGLMETIRSVRLLGDGSVLRNRGTIAPGGLGTIGGTRIVADRVVFKPSSVLAVDLDPSRTRGGAAAAAGATGSTAIAGDRLLFAAADGGVEFGGTIVPTIQVRAPGATALSGELALISAETATGGFVARDAGAVGYDVVTDGGDVTLAYTIDTTPWEGPLAPLVDPSVAKRVNANHDAFGAYLQDLLTVEPVSASSGAFVSELAGDLLNLPDAGSLLDAYDGFIADEVLAVPEATILSSVRFSDELHSCGRRDADRTLRFDEEGTCGWARVYGQALSRDSSGAGSSYDETLFGLTAGGQAEVAQGLFIGGALGFETGSLSMPAADGDVTRFEAGVVGKWVVQGTTFAASVGGGFFQSEINRSVSLPSGVLARAKSDPDGGFVSGHVRIDHRFELGGVSLSPTLDAGVTYVAQGAFQERGAGGYGLSVARVDEVVATLNPFLGLDAPIQLGTLAGEVSLRAGLLAVLGDDPSTNAAFLGAGAGSPTFRIKSDMQNLFADLGAALEVGFTDRVSVKGNINALVAAEQQVLGGGLRLNIAF